MNAKLLAEANPAAPANDPLDIELPAALAISKSGKAEPTHANAGLVLAGLPGSIRLERFSQRVVCEGLGAWHMPDGEWGDTRTTALVSLCEQNGLPVSPTVVDRAVLFHAEKHAYNVLTDFAEQCAAQWDGVARVDRAFTTYWRAADTSATRAVARVFFLSLLRRALDPGAKVDTCAVFVGAQGVGKSRALRALVGPAWFADSPLPIGDKDGMQALPGTWLWEFAENESISKRDAEATKAYLSQSLDKYRPSFGRHTVTVPRQTCFASTTNDAQTLNDPTGARRFLPVTVGAVDVDGIERDRLQLLGEAASRVLAGEQHWPTPAETAALADVREDHRAADPWEEPMRAWLETHGNKPIELMALFETDTTADKSKVAGPLPMPAAKVGKREQGRASAVLRALGWERRRSKVRASRGRYLWHPPT